MPGSSVHNSDTLHQVRRLCNAKSKAIFIVTVLQDPLLCLVGGLPKAMAPFFLMT